MKKTLGPAPILLPMPAVLIGTYDDDGTPNAMTAAWASACCHSPPCLGVAIRAGRLTHSNILATGAFTVNVPGTALARQVDYLGIVSGRQRPDKLAAVGLESARGAAVNAPVITACPVNAECRLFKSVELGSHTWFVGEVLEVQADEQVLRGDGKIDVGKLDPLAYLTSAADYWSLGAAVGAAYSIGKGAGGE